MPNIENNLKHFTATINDKIMSDFQPRQLEAKDEPVQNHFSFITRKSSFPTVSLYACYIHTYIIRLHLKFLNYAKEGSIIKFSKRNHLYSATLTYFIAGRKDRVQQATFHAEQIHSLILNMIS
jgi:hypothetical protein